MLKFGTTFKTTQRARHAATNRLITELARDSTSVILDIGASDGCTSLDLISELGPNFAAYYVTDYNVETFFGVDEAGVAFFRDSADRCVLRATDRFIVYSDVTDAPAPLAWLARRLLRGERRVRRWERVPLFQPAVLQLAQTDPRVIVCKYDMFTAWRGRTPTITKIANVLNRAYFSDSDIVRVLRVQHAALADGGHLAIVENRGSAERATIYRRTDSKLEVAATVGAGCEIADLIADIGFS